MANKTISDGATVAFKDSLLIPAVDTTLPLANQNVNLLGSSFPSGAGGGATKVDDLTDASDLTGAPYSFVGFDGSAQPAVILGPVANTLTGYNSSGIPLAYNRLAALTLLGLDKDQLVTNISPVTNSTTYISASLPEAFVINSMDAACAVGSFTATININATPVTGLSAVAVSTGAVKNTKATAANVAAKGSIVTVVCAGATGSPTNAVIQLNVTRS